MGYGTFSNSPAACRRIFSDCFWLDTRNGVSARALTHSSDSSSGHSAKAVLRAGISLACGRAGVFIGRINQNAKLTRL